MSRIPCPTAAEESFAMLKFAVVRKQLPWKEGRKALALALATGLELESLDAKQALASPVIKEQ